MNKIKPINWADIDREVTGMLVEDAVRAVFAVVVAKINELVAIESQR